MDFAGPIEGRGNMSFEMFKSSLNKKGNKLSFEVKGLGKKNKELVADLVRKDLDSISLFIDDAIFEADVISANESVSANINDDLNLRLKLGSVGGQRLSYASMAGLNLRGFYLRNAYLNNADLSDSDMTGAELTGVYAKEATFARANLQNVSLMPNPGELGRYPGEADSYTPGGMAKVLSRMQL